MSRLFFVALLFLTIYSCHENYDQDHMVFEANVRTANNAVVQTSSSVEMAQLLKELHGKIDPMKVPYFENSKRAELMSEKYTSSTEPVQRMLFKMRYGMELISAGKNENAVVVLTEVREEMKSIGFKDINKYFSACRALAIAYLRVAETQNCLDKTNSKMCLMPLSKEAQFLDKRSLKSAILILEEMLSLSKNNEESIWLLNFAHMAAGTYPSGLSEEHLLPPSSFDSEYDLNTFVNIAAKVNANTKGLSGGSVMDDFNNDGHLDLVSSSWDLTKGIQLLINDGVGNFTNKETEAGLSGISGGLNIRQVDFNNDGHLDLFVLRGAWFGPFGQIPNSLLMNMGNGTFSDVTKELGLLSFYPTQTCIWRDFNFDGRLDLFIANESNSSFSCPNEFYIQQSDGTFKNIIDQIEALKNEHGFAKGCAAGDVNNDGLEDIYLSYNGAKNKLFLNTTKDGRISFKDISKTANIADPIGSFPTWFWDYNNDGLEDILAAEFGSVSKAKSAYVSQNYKGIEVGSQPRIYKNNGDNTFSEISKALGITDAIFSMGSNFGDLDNDGYQDFYLGTGSPNFTSIIPNRMFRNNKGKQFQDVTTSGGFGHLQKGHGVSFGDIDNDGDQDVFCVLGGAYEGDVANDALFQNPGNNNSWITLKLVGDLSNKSAIGARVKLEYRSKDALRQTQFHTVSAGGSFGANSLQLECGLGTANKLDRVTITWPNRDKSQSIFEDLLVNSSYMLFEKNDQWEKLK